MRLQELLNNGEYEIIMRNILFRAKTIESNSKWVYGLITKMCGKLNIVSLTGENTAYPIIKDTICQYTGVNDKNNIKIFNGDILEFTDNDGAKVLELVSWNEKTLSYNIYQNGNKQLPDDFTGFEQSSYRYEVVGNIYDNKTLLCYNHNNKT